MHKPNPLIGLLLPAPFIAEGIAAVLRRCEPPVRTLTLERLSDLEPELMQEVPGVVIADPACMVNRAKEFAAVKKMHPTIVWIGFVYSYHDPLLLGRFDHLIQVGEPATHLTTLISRLGVSQDAVETESGQLSDRETEVLRLLVNGMSQKEIADRLNISIHTVISHRKNISQKTGIKSQSGLTIYALTNGIIMLGDYPG